MVGMCDGFVELIKHHYSKFKAIFPNINDNYWNPAISWENKWNSDLKTEKFFLSSTALVFLTDAYHLVRMISKINLSIAFGLLIGTNILIWIAIIFTIHTVGFYITYK